MQGCTQEDVESILYTIKEINSVAGCCVYTVACTCCINELPLVREISEKVFINTKVLFWCDNTIRGTRLIIIIQR